MTVVALQHVLAGLRKGPSLMVQYKKAALKTQVLEHSRHQRGSFLVHYQAVLIKIRVWIMGVCRFA